MSPRLGEVVLATQSDERLVKLARAGHERAFAVIVERYRPELFAFARRLSPDGKAEDIVQQAFLSAFAALRDGADVKHLRGWLYRIVRNAAARSQAPPCMPLDGATASGESVEDVVQQRALAKNALAELARLPDRQREAIVGTALDGRGRAEVATSMGVSEGAIRQLVHRGRARIRTAVTAVVPWPVLRWFAAARPGSGRAVSVAAGTGAASSGGVGLKLGIVFASGAIATGVAAVDLRGGGRRPDRAGPRVASRDVDPRAARSDGRVLTVDVVARAPIGADSPRGSHMAGAAAADAPRVRVRRGEDGAAAPPEGHRHPGEAGSSRHSDRGDGAGSRPGDGSGSGWGDSAGAGGSEGGGGPRDGGSQGQDGRSFSAPEAVIANDGGFTRGSDRGGFDGSSSSGTGFGSGSGAGPASGDTGSGTVSGAGSGAGTASRSASGSGSGSGSGAGARSGSGAVEGSPVQGGSGSGAGYVGSGH